MRHSSKIMVVFVIAALAVSAYAEDEPRMTARQAEAWLGVAAHDLHEVPASEHVWPREPHVRVACEGKALAQGVAVHRCAEERLIRPGRVAVQPEWRDTTLYGPGWPRASGRAVARTGDWRHDIAWWCEDTNTRRTRRFIERAGNVAEVAPVCVPRETA